MIGLLVLECLLWLSAGVRWPAWHKGYAVLTAVGTVGGATLLMGMWFAVAMLLRRRFQFSIRSLLVLTVATAVPFSWLAVEMKKAREQAEIVEETTRLGMWAAYDDPADTSLSNTEPQALAWLRNRLGKDFFLDVVGLSVPMYGWDPDHEPCPWPYKNITDATFARVERLGRLQWLDVSDSVITDATLERMAGLVELQTLSVNATGVTDAGVRKLQQALPKCKIEWSPPTTPTR